jgi:hypothetical protein
MGIIKLNAFSVIGKLGSTKGNKEGFIKELINETNSNFADIKNLAKEGFTGEWGLMSSFKEDLSPWENNFSEGLYLYGVECDPSIKKEDIPVGWVKWDVPSRDYVRAKVDDLKNYLNIFRSHVYFLLAYNGLTLSGAAFDFHDNKENADYIYFPVEKTKREIVNKLEKNKIAYCGIHCTYCFFTSCDSCRGTHNECSLAYSEPDHICPNVKCCKSKNLDGCYECKDLENCKIGIFKMDEAVTTKTTCMFIKKYGLDAFDNAVRNMIKDGKNYSKDIDDIKSIEDKMKYLFEYSKK